MGSRACSCAVSPWLFGERSAITAAAARMNAWEIFNSVTAAIRVARTVHHADTVLLATRPGDELEITDDITKAAGPMTVEQVSTGVHRSPANSDYLTTKATRGAHGLVG